MKYSIDKMYLASDQVIVKTDHLEWLERETNYFRQILVAWHDKHKPKCLLLIDQELVDKICEDFK